MTNREAVHRTLAEAKRGMSIKEIGEFAEKPMTPAQIRSAIANLKRDKAVKNLEPGIYVVEGGRPLEKQQRQDRPLDSKVVIPCYGICWERSLIAWKTGSKRELWGQSKGGKPVNFVNQPGVYVLYQWPRVNYVGMTTKDLYGRLYLHNKDRRMGPWDKFSWFGLRPVHDGVLVEPKRTESIKDELTMVEAVLISALNPPLNDKAGEKMGKEYFQMPSSEVKEEEQKRIAKMVADELSKGLSGRS